MLARLFAALAAALHARPTAHARRLAPLAQGADVFFSTLLVLARLFAELVPSPFGFGKVPPKRFV